MSYLNKVSKQVATEFLFQDGPVGLACIAARDEGWEEDIGQLGVTEVLEW